MNTALRPFSAKTLILFFIFLAAVLFGTNTFAVMPPDNSGGEKSHPAQSSKKVHGPRKEGELLVKLREGAVAKNAKSLAASLGASHAENFKITGKGKGAARLKRWWHVKLPPGKDMDAAIAKLKAHRDVEVVEPNYAVSVQATPNDPLLYDLWGMHNTGQTGGTDDADIDATEAWDTHTGSGDVVVAVIDTGIVYSHEDLAANMWTNPGEIPGNGLDDDGNGYVDDVYGYDFAYGDADPFDEHGHGTHCAGTIAGVGNNGIGVAGVNWNARLMALKFLDDDGYGWTSDAVNAVIYATNMGADVMSNSWGGGGFSQALEDAISAANDAGVLFVAAAGNDNADNDLSPHYPSNYDLPNVISVAATDHTDNRASFSNFGATTVHLGAPGVNIVSTVPKKIPCFTFWYLCSETGYRGLSGTSMATPHVAGAAALLLSHMPNSTVEEIKAALLSSVDPIAALAGITVSGGRLNVHNALEQLHYTIAISPSQQEVLHGGSISYTLTLTSKNSFTDTLTLSLDPLATGLSGAASPASLTLPADGTASATVTITAAAGMNRGTYPLRVLVTDSGSTTRRVDASLRVLVPDYSANITPATQVSGRGNNRSYNVVLGSIDGFTGPVSLSAAASDPSLSATLVPTTLTVPTNGSVSAVLSVDVSANAPLQTNTLTVTATGNGASKTVSAQLQVVDRDLAPVSISTATTPVGIGSPIVVADSVMNNGSEAAGGFVVGYYLSTDATIDTSDILIGTRSVAGVGAGATNSASTTVTIPTTVAPANYYLGMIVDYLDDEPESNEANNALAGTAAEVIYGVELVVTAATPSTTALNAGGSFTIDNTVANQGTAPIWSGFDVSYYLSSDAVIDTNDTQIGERTIGSLAAGGSSTASTTVTLAADLAPGTYYLGVIADYADTQPESDETNNVRVAGQVTVARDIDLTMTAATASSTTLYTGASFTLDETVTNQGSAVGATSFKVGYYLSSDAVVDTTDTRVGERTVSSLAAGASNAATSTVTLSSTLAPGSYYLGVIADYADAQPEQNESNNTLVVGQVTLVRDVDLTVTAATPSTTALYTGANFNLNNTVANQGSSAITGLFHVGYYLSTDAVVDTSDTRIGDRWIDTLAAGASSNVNGTVYVPTEVAVGTYYLGVIADYNNTQTENNEANNVMVVGQVTVAKDIDLVVSALMPTTTTLYGGASYNVDDMVTNLGHSTAPAASFVGYYLSSDAVIDTTDTRIGARTLYTLFGQMDNSATGAVTIPTTLATGTYYLGAIADFSNVLSESNETNNAFVAGQVTVIRDIDIAVTAATSSTTALYTGASFTVNNTVVNQATTMTASSFGVTFRLSTDAVITTSDTPLGYRTISSLAAGAANTEATTVTVPTALAAGTYYLGVIADYANTHPEDNETNNVLVVGQVTVAQSIDLTVTAATPSNTTLYTGASFTLSNTEANQGNSGASFHYVGYYLSTDAVVNTSDIYLGYRQVGSLAPGGTSTANSTIALAANLTPGTYYLGVIADFYSHQSEADETNNVLVAGQVNVVRDIDVMVTTATSSTTALTAGASFTLNNTVVNLGNSASNGGFYVGYYLSSDAVIDATDTLIGNRNVSSLGAGGTSAVNSTVTVPTTVQAGTYYLGVFADHSNTQAESYEANNVQIIGQVTVVRDLDLAMTAASVASTTLYTGANVTINNTVANQGSLVSAGTFKVGFYLSTDAVIDTTDWRFAERTIYGLAAGGTSAVNSTVTLHQAAAPGTYYLGVIADHANTQTETDETDNVFVVGQVTVVRDVDLIMTDATPSTTTLTRGASFTLSNTVKNQGNSPAFPWGTWISVNYRLSSDEVIDASDAQLGYRSIYIWGNLGAGGTDAANSTVTVPANLAPGTYYLGVTVDTGNSITESNDTNNVFVYSIPVIVN